MRRFSLTIFLLVFFSGFTFLRFPAIQAGITDHVVDELARVSAGIIQPFDNDVYASGNQLSSHKTGFAVAILPGCDGLEAIVMLWAAIIAFPGSWKGKILGILLGGLSIQILNLARIISLFYIAQWNEVIFRFAHGFLWPALIMLDAVMIFLVWIAIQGHRNVAPAA